MIFKVKIMDKLQLITCPRDMDKTVLHIFELKQEEFVKANAMVSVLDFAETETLDDSSARVFVQFKRNLKNGGKSLVSIKVPLKVLLQMKKAGIEDVFQPVKNLEEVCKKFGIEYVKPPKIEIKFINPFISAIINYFKKTDKVQLKMNPPKVRKEDSSFGRGIIANINLVSPTLNGSIRIFFEQKLAISLCNVFENKNLNSMNDQVQIFVGNFVQEIFNEASLALKQSGFDNIIESYPTIFETSEGSKMNSNENEVAIVIDFETTLGSFNVEIISQ